MESKLRLSARIQRSSLEYMDFSKENFNEEEKGEKKGMGKGTRKRKEQGKRKRKREGNVKGERKRKREERSARKKKTLSLQRRHWWTNTGKGKCKRTLDSEATETLDLDKEFAIIWREPEWLRGIDMFPSQFSFDERGGLRVNLFENPKITLYPEPMITVSFELYSTWLRRVSAVDRDLVVDYKPLETIDQLPKLQLRLPSNHEYLKDFQLMSRNWRYRRSKEPISGDIIRDLILTNSRISIIGNEKSPSGKWKENEQQTYIFNYVRESYMSSCDVRIQALKNFCAGIGPTDYSFYAKQIIDKDIKKHKQSHSQEPFYVDRCWAHLYKDIYPSLSEATLVIRATKDSPLCATTGSATDMEKQANFIKNVFNGLKQATLKRKNPVKRDVVEKVDLDVGYEEKDEAQRSENTKPLRKKKSFKETFYGIVRNGIWTESEARMCLDLVQTRDVRKEGPEAISVGLSEFRTLNRETAQIWKPVIWKRLSSNTVGSTFQDGLN